MKRLSFLVICVVASLLCGEARAQRVTNASYQTVAYIKPDGTIQDASYHTVGHIKGDGTVQDGSYRTIGHIKSDGTVQDGNYRTIGYAKDIPRAWAAWYFFF